MTRDIERLVESGYSHLQPSAQLEDEVLARLPAQKPRARPLAALGVAAVLLVALAVGVWGGEEDQPSAADGATESLVLATVKKPKSGTVASAKDDFQVRLPRGGSVQLRGGDGKWNRVTLDELGSALRREDGRVVIHADREAPLIHLQWIMLVCAEQRRPQIALAVKEKGGGTFLLDASLPVGVDVKAFRNNISARVMVRDDKWIYRVDDAETEGLSSFECLLEVRHEKNPEARGIVQAPRGMRFDRVAEMVVAFRLAGFDAVGFYGTAIPPKTIRSTRILPFPGREWVLEFSVAEGDPGDLERAAKIVKRRLKEAGLRSDGVSWSDEGLRVHVKPGDDMELARRLIEDRGATLEFHITVEPGTEEYAAAWKRKQEGLAPTKEFRWYALQQGAEYSKDRLPKGGERVVLCRMDKFGITAASLEKIAAERSLSEFGSHWAVVFSVRKEHQDNMAALTQVTDGEDRYLAIIVNGRVHSAPVLRDRLRTNGQITGAYSEREAKALAALLQSERLPLRFAIRR